MSCVTIDYGISNWEILQQTDGFATVTVGGTWDTEFSEDAKGIMVRVLKEDSYEWVTEPIYVETTEPEWSCTLTLPIGGLYTMETSLWRYTDHKCGISGGRGEYRYHFGVGDLFLMIGQSNAAAFGRGTGTDAAELGVHVLRSGNDWDLATHPLRDIDSMHSPWLAFAKVMKKELNYPIGLLPLAIGGTTLAQWHKAESGECYRQMEEVIRKHHLHPKAALWYQGCSDTFKETAPSYLERFRDMLKDLRQDTGVENLPVFTCQLNRCTNGTFSQEHHDYYGIIREIQRQAPKKIPNVYVLPTIDCTHLSDQIHNSRVSNIMLGERMARQVLYELYGKGLGVKVPEIASVVRKGNQVTFLFDNVTTDLYVFLSKKEDLPVFVRDDEGRVEISEYSVCANRITITLARETKGALTAYCQADANPRFYVMDWESHLPALSFYGVEVTED